MAVFSAVLMLIALAVVAWVLVFVCRHYERVVAEMVELNSRERSLAQVRSLEHARKLEEDCLILTEQILRDSGKQVTLYRRPPIEKTGQAPLMNRGWQSTRLATTPEQDALKIEKSKENV